MAGAGQFVAGDADPSGVDPPSHRIWLVLASVWVVLWFVILGIRPLFNPDEGRYADIPYEMLGSGDWLLPRLNGLIYLEKPPLQYWAAAVSLAVFGHHEWAVRFFTGLAAIATLGPVYFLGRRRWNAARGGAAAAITGSMLLFVCMGQIVTLDMALTFFLTLTTVAFCLAQQERERNVGWARRWMLLAWCGMALATLTKGLLGVFVPACVLVLYSVLQRDWRVWKHLYLLPGLTLYLLVTLPWFAMVERTHPGALDVLIIREHVQRYLTMSGNRYQPWWYFPMIFLVGTVPWLPQSIRGLAIGWRAERPAGQFDVGRLLWTGAVFMLVFFSVSKSKLAPYILPVLPLLALLGSRCDAIAGSDLRISIGMYASLGLLLLLALGIYAMSDSGMQNLWMFVRLWPWLSLVALVMLVGAAIAWDMRAQFASGLRALALTAGTAGLLLVVGAATSVSPKYSGRSLVRSLGSIDVNTPIYAIRTFDWTIPFYTRHVITPVEWRGELDYGLRFDPARAIDRLDAFETRWRAGGLAYAIMNGDTFELLTTHGLPMRVIDRTPKLLFIAKP